MYPHDHELPLPWGFMESQSFHSDDSFDSIYILPSTSTSTSLNSFPPAPAPCLNMPPTQHNMFPHSTRVPAASDAGWLAVPQFTDIPPYHNHNVSVGLNDLLPWPRYAPSAGSPQPSQSDRSSTPALQASNDISYYGTPTGDGTWRCSYPGCASRTVFHRGCDLRKHYKRHGRHFFCRHTGCPKSTSGGFSSRKDRGRHEAKHNPSIQCGWEGCPRIFSRVDNMRDHVRRVHQKKSRSR